MGIILVATVEMGRIEQLGGSAVITRFRVLNFLPLYAHDSVLVVNDGQRIQRIPIHKVTRSVLAGYGRIWLPLIAALLGLVGADAWPRWGVAAPALSAALACGLASAYLWLRFGRLSPSEARRRLAYAVWIGAPIDVGLVPESAEYPFEAKLHALLDERAAVVPEGYRARLSPAERWKTAAMESSDPEALIAAVTRARWERRRARGEEQASLDKLHDALWAKLDPLLVAGKGPPAYAAWERYVREYERRGAVMPRKEKALAAAGIGLVLIAGAVTAYHHTASKLVIANVSGVDGLTVLLDGEPVAKALPAARREGDGGFATKLLRPGEHELVAWDDHGAEVDRQRFVVDQGTPGLIYAPARSPTMCFAEEIVVYSSSRSLRQYETVPLPMTRPLRIVQDRIDFWFEDPPEKVEVSGTSQSVERRTLRAQPCAEL